MRAKKRHMARKHFLCLATAFTFASLISLGSGVSSASAQGRGASAAFDGDYAGTAKPAGCTSSAVLSPSSLEMTIAGSRVTGPLFGGGCFDRKGISLQAIYYP
jgi:hypothetical protein